MLVWMVEVVGYYNLNLHGFSVYRKSLCSKRSIKLIQLCNSFSIVNFIVGCFLFHSSNISSLFTFGNILNECHLHIENIYYIQQYLLILGTFVCVLFYVCMLQLILLMLERPQLVHLFVRNISFQNEFSFVPLLFLVCVLFPFGYFC